MTLFTTKANQIPGCRLYDAIERGVEKNLMFAVGGGLGDVICAIPTILFAIDNFKDCKISVMTQFPELFEKLPLEDVFVTLTKTEMDRYFWLNTYPEQGGMCDQFFTANTMSVVDFCSLASIRQQLPFDYRELIIDAREGRDKIDSLKLNELKDPVILHPGKTWASRTMPSEWWESLISWIDHFGMASVLIGTKKDTVDLSVIPVVDLRSELSLIESIYLLQHSQVVITNDSSPLHMAASRFENATHEGPWIGYISTVKHPDLLKHYRSGEFGYKMRDFSRGGYWQQNLCPNRAETLNAKEATQEQMQGWLPDTHRLAEWCKERFELEKI